MTLRQLFDAETSTYTYLLVDPITSEAALIDPVLEQTERDLAYMNELGVTLTHILETHTHADHVTGATVLREATGAKIVTGPWGPDCSDIKLKHGDVMAIGESLEVQVLETPGHTDDSVSYYVRGHVFTGDALLIRRTGRTDFQGGSAGQLYDSVTNVLFQLPESTTVHPAHDYRGRTVSTIREEKRLNLIVPESRGDFIERMNALHTPVPRKMHFAVPANRKCGVLPQTQADPDPSPRTQLPGRKRRTFQNHRRIETATIADARSTAITLSGSSKNASVTS